MKVFNIFKTQKYRRENRKLKRDINKLEHERKILGVLLSPDMQNAVELDNHINKLYKERKSMENELDNMHLELFELNNNIEGLKIIAEERKKELTSIENKITLQDFGFNASSYNYSSYNTYGYKLEIVKKRQEKCIVERRAIVGNMDFTINGSEDLGNTLVESMEKLLLRTFNLESDYIIEHINYINYKAALFRLRRCLESTNKLGYIANMSISQEYFDLKLEEASLIYSFKQKEYEDMNSDNERIQCS